jgi:predicted glycogen debranching enzyme
MKLPLISLDRKALANFDDAVQKEWIITNGLGGYASSTALGTNTRKYHGLLVAALHPPGDRRVLLSKLDEELTIGGSTYPLGANEFQSGVFPQGHSFVKEFSISPFPRQVYSAESVKVQKTVFVPHEMNAVVVLYKLLNRNSVDVKFRVFPLVNWRHFHSVTNRWKVSAEPVQKCDGREVSIRLGPPESALVFDATGGKYRPNGKWFEKVFYREEARRGESCLDDCYQIGYFETGVTANSVESFAVVAAAGESEDDAQSLMSKISVTLYDLGTSFEKEAKRYDNLLGFFDAHKTTAAEDWLKWLVLATDAFVVRGADASYRSVIAGYHWFEAWGRDVFVSLPGLMLVTGRFGDARKVFLTFKGYLRNGLIPNFLPDQAAPAAYNTVDASLWYVNAVLQYLKHSGDFKFVQEQLWESLKEIVDEYVKGTDFGIRVDNDGLLCHGARLTWMDAAVDGQSVTPRAGKAVEVQALWYNALRTVELLANRFGEKDEAERCWQIAEKAKKSFVEKFWNAEKNCLFDVVNEHGKDSSMRPNQVFAVALDFEMLDEAKKERIVDAVHGELLTPLGLQTLAKSDPRYAGVYGGERGKRDRAYHNGTVWPWLSGPFTTAFLKVKGNSEFRREFAMKYFLSPLFGKLVSGVGLGVLGEVFDGDPPHAPEGCIAQAWSIAEPLRAYTEDITQIRPEHEKEVLQKLG